ncbi:cyclase family protein [Anaerolineales bacterium HSG24]|nr:cyclase family protein [Anaerolineales bacterium HSG24]
MKPKFYDISRTINSRLAVWPGDSIFSAPKVADMDRGEVVNVSELTFSSHFGTHVDAPLHFVADEQSIDQLPIDIFIGPATLITVSQESGPLVLADFPNLDWSTVERLLIHSPASHKPVDQFHEQFVYPSLELIDLMGQHNIRLFGTDSPSVDAFEGKDGLVGHYAMQQNGIIILEGLMLADVPDGEYELMALPLKLEGGDGCPVRAVLRRVEPN